MGWRGLLWKRVEMRWGLLDEETEQSSVVREVKSTVW